MIAEVAGSSSLASSWNARPCRGTAAFAALGSTGPIARLEGIGSPDYILPEGAAPFLNNFDQNEGA